MRFFHVFKRSNQVGERREDALRVIVARFFAGPRKIKYLGRYTRPRILQPLAGGSGYIAYISLILWKLASIMGRMRPEKNAEPLQAVGGAETPLVARAAGTITRSLVTHVGSIVASCGASAVLVYADALEEDGLSLLEGFRCKVFFVTKTPRQERQQEEKGTCFIRVPDVPLSRLGQVKIAVFMALTKGLVSRGDLVVCLSGFTASGTLDTLVVTEVGSEFEMLAPL